MKKIYFLGFMVTLFLTTAGLNKFEKQIEKDKSIYKHNLNISYSFNLNDLKSELDRYKELTNGLNTYFFSEDTYYVNFTKKTSEPFLSSNVENIIDSISDKVCITSQKDVKSECKFNASLEYPFDKEIIKIRSIENLASNVKGKVEVYILEDSTSNIEKFKKLNEEFIVTGNVKGKESFNIDNFEFYSIIMISLFSYYFLKKAKEKGVLRINGATFNKMMIADIVKIFVYLTTSMFFIIMTLVFFKGIKYITFRYNILSLALFHNSIILIFTLGMSLALNKFEKINNLIKLNIKNRFFIITNFLGALAISFLFIFSFSQSLTEYQILQIKKERIERVVEILKKEKGVDITNERELFKRLNSFLDLKKDAYEFAEEKKQDYYYKSMFPPEVIDKENTKLPVFILVNSSFIEEKFGTEIAKNLTDNKIHIFKNQNSVVSDNQISNITRKIIDFFVMNSTTMEGENLNKDQKNYIEKIIDKKQQRKDQEIAAGIVINNMESSKIEDVVVQYDKELGDKYVTYQFTDDIVYVYYPYDKSVNDLYGIYLRDSSQKTNEQINNDLIEYFEGDNGNKLFFNQDKNELLKGSVTTYQKLEEEMIKETQRIKEEEVKVVAASVFMVMIIVSFINYYFKQNIREYSVYKTLGFKELTANKKTITIIMASLITALLPIIYIYNYLNMFNTIMINSLTITLSIELSVMLVSTYIISRAKKKNNNTAYYVNGGEL